MTVKESGSISISDIKSGTGLSSNNLGAYYRSTGVSGYAPASGQISFSDLYGAYQLTSLSDYLQTSYYQAFYDSWYSGTMYNDFYGTTSIFGQYSTGYNNFWYYYSPLNALGASGTTWPGTSNTTSTLTANYAGFRSVYSGFPTLYNSGYSSTGYGTGYPRAYNTGKMLPMGAIGETGTERVLAFRTAAGISSGSWFYTQLIMWEIFPNQTFGNSYYTYNSFGVPNYTALNDSNYCVGVRISTDGTLYLGRYSWPASASSTATVNSEVSMFGSAWQNRNNQLSFGVSMTVGSYNGSSVGFYFYENGFWNKGAYEPRGWNFSPTSNSAVGAAVSNLGFRGYF